MKMSEMSISDILDAYVATILACGNADAQGHKIIRRAIEKRLARLAALVEKLPKYADTGEVFVPCVDKAYATLKRNPDKKHTWQVFEITAACYNLGGWCWMLHALFTPQKTPAYSTREAATAAQKENDNGCTDTTG